MTKLKTDRRIKPYNPREEYRSVEGRIYDHVIAPFGRAARDGIAGCYEVASTPFKIPTAIRRIRNDQYCDSPYNLCETGEHALMGGFMGVIVDGILIALAIGDAVSDPSFSPYLAAGWLATNLASGIYEWGRREQSRKERLGYWNFSELQRKEKEAKEKAKNDKKSN